jgi:tetratricopeptide (TPR) repeat protein
LHFKPAADVLLRAEEHVDWARAELLLAQALKSQGDVQGDVVTLRDAVSGFRKAMGILTRDRDMAAWAEAQCGLGATLQRICEETGDFSDLPTAIEALEFVLKLKPVVDWRVIADAEAAMARAKILLASARSDMHQLEQAISLLKNAREAMARDVSTMDLADVERCLGSALWSFEEARGADADLAEAAAVFESALKRYEAQDDDVNVEMLRERIAVLHDQMGVESAPAA